MDRGSQDPSHQESHAMTQQHPITDIVDRVRREMHRALTAYSGVVSYTQLQTWETSLALALAPRDQLHIDTKITDRDDADRDDEIASTKTRTILREIIEAERERDVTGGFRPSLAVRVEQLYAEIDQRLPPRLKRASKSDPSTAIRWSAQRCSSARAVAAWSFNCLGIRSRWGSIPCRRATSPRCSFVRPTRSSGCEGVSRPLREEPFK
jgi:hypothetical protein